MKIGIVTTWFERGAAYVSRQFEEVLSSKYEVKIYARGGESYAKGNPIWDKPNVTWGVRIRSPFAATTIERKDFEKWLKVNNIGLVIFNEQHWFQPILWCKELGIKTIAYIDYYNENMIPLFKIYDALICNTKRHLEAFSEHPNAVYVPWGTNVDLFKPNQNNLVDSLKVTFFHSAGVSGHRKGTDLFIKSLESITSEYKAIIHTQSDLFSQFPELSDLMTKLITDGHLEIITGTYPAPGLYYKGDVYVYPSRLEGIGLTIAEAISSGLACVVTDNGPMNEFVNENIGATIPVSKFYSRADGYYWPKCECCVDKLTATLQNYVNNRDLVLKQKFAARQYAMKNLSYKKNFEKLVDMVEKVQFYAANEKLISLINQYDSFGLKKMQKYYLGFKLYKIWH